MYRFIRNSLFAGLTVAALFLATPTITQANDYWDNYWRWYDNDYSRHYNRRHSGYRYRDPNQHYYRDYRSPYHGRHYDYGYGRRGGYYRPYGRGYNSVQFGDFRFSWR